MNGKDKNVLHYDAIGRCYLSDDEAYLDLAQSNSRGSLCWMVSSTDWGCIVLDN